MREILFRGKKKDSGEWVCGDLIQLHEEAPYWYILPEGISSEMYEDEPYHFRQNDVMCSVALAKIIPETVGQFTGLTDKNGKKIFEGDIVKDGAHTFKVCYYDYGWFCYCVSSKGYILPLHKYFRIGQWDNCENNDFRKLEVIGNIHDTPEFLEKFK